MKSLLIPIFGQFCPPSTHFRLLIFLLLFTANLQAQMDKWILNPNEIDFDAGTATDVVNNVATPYKVENVVYREGDFLFYANDGIVSDLNGFNLGQFAIDPGAMLKEIAIAPAPGTCDSWCLFWLETSPPAYLNFYYQEVKSVGAEVFFATGGLLAGTPTIAGNYGGIAVSPVVEGTVGERDIYLVTASVVLKYRLTALQGMTLQETITVGTGASQFIAEADLSPDGRWLGWAGSSTLHVMDMIDPAHPVLNRIVNGDDGAIFGVEFSGEHLYFCHSDLGLGRWLFTSTDPTEYVTGGTAFMQTHLEAGKDGFIYAVENSGALRRVQDLAISAPPFNVLVASNNPDPPGYTYYALPDQVDGEGYYNFIGVPPVRFTHFTINGNEVFDFVDATHPPLKVYNCAPINLDTGVEGIPSEWEIHIYSTDANGNQVSGPFFLDYTTSGTDPLPSPIDLRCLQNSLCTLFTNYINPPFNTFAVEVVLRNRCSETVRLGHFAVHDAPDPAQIGLQVNNQNTGIPCNASHNIINPCIAGYANVSINLSNSNGDISYYRITIEEVFCKNGTILGTIYQGPQVLVNGVSGLTALGLNTLVINGSTGYFNTPAWDSRCIKVTVWVGNECDEAFDWTYVKFNGPNFQDPGNEDRAGAEETNDSKPSIEEGGNQLKSQPNPFSGDVNISFDLEGNAPVSMSVTDASGKVVKRLLDQAHLAEGEQTIILAGSDLSPGLYFLHLSTPFRTAVSKLIKIQ